MEWISVKTKMRKIPKSCTKCQLIDVQGVKEYEHISD